MQMILVGKSMENLNGVKSGKIMPSDISGRVEVMENYPLMMDSLPKH